MRRLFRLLFTALCALSLLLCVATVGLWVRSYCIVDTLDCNFTSNSTAKLRWCGIGLESWNGHAELTLDYDGIFTRLLVPPQERLHFSVTHSSLRNYSWSQNDLTWSWCGFYSAFPKAYIASSTIDMNSPAFGTKYYGAPDWFIVLLTALASAILLLRKLRQRMPQQGCCPDCGYDLRATPERCPECGLAVRPDHLKHSRKPV